MKTLVFIGILALSLAIAPLKNQVIKKHFSGNKISLSNKDITKNDIKLYIKDQCKGYDLEYKLIIALIKAESNFRLYCKEIRYYCKCGRKVPLGKTEHKCKCGKIVNTKTKKNVSKSRLISLGLFQNSFNTAAWYRNEKKIKLKICPKKWLFNWKNNIDVALWNIGTRYQYFYNAYKHRFSHKYTKILAHKIAFSCHNMGEAGRMKFKKETGWLYYPKYIRAIEKKLGYKIK